MRRLHALSAVAAGATGASWRFATATTSCSAATATTRSTPARGATWSGATTSPPVSRPASTIRCGAARARPHVRKPRQERDPRRRRQRWIKAHFGFGLVNCGGGNDLLYISRRAQKHYKIRNCERISHRTLGRW